MYDVSIPSVHFPVLDYDDYRLCIINDNRCRILRTLSAQILQKLGGRARIFSIDGSHTAEATYKDLQTATRSLSVGGIIMIDDMFAAGWPGVSEGVFRFMMVSV